MDVGELIAVGIVAAAAAWLVRRAMVRKARKGCCAKGCPADTTQSPSRPGQSAQRSHEPCDDVRPSDAPENSRRA